MAGPSAEAPRAGPAPRRGAGGPPPLQRILVVLPNWYGETLFATPFLRLLRQQQPEAFLATLGSPRCREVLAHHPGLDAIIDYDERGTHRSLLAKWRLARQLRRERFDAAFILRRSLSRTVFVALAGIPTRVGTANPKTGWLLTHRAPTPVAPLHKASTYLPLLEAVGLSAVPGPYEYTVTALERRQARERLAAERADGRPLVVLHPGANWAHKRWPPERFAALADRLIASRGAQVAVTGGPDDAPLAEAITGQMRQRALVLTGRTTLRELGAVLGEAALVVANDTGVLHLAAALGRPVVALFGPTSPRLTGPLGDPARTIVLHHPDCCPRVPCTRPHHPAHPGMAAISVEEVYEAAVRLLSRHA